MTENEDYEDWDEESEEWSPEWYPFPENQDKLVEKKWIRYTGPLGGTGWQSTKDPEVIRYQEDMPHEKEEGQAPHQSLHPKKEVTFDREEMMERYAKRWLANSPKGSKIYITKLAKGEEYVKTEGWRVELFYPRIRNEKDMMKQAYYHLHESWVAPDMPQVHEASRFTQKMFMEASGMTDEEGRVLLTMEKTWTGGDVRRMRNTLASATTGILPPQSGPYRGQSIYSNESRSALKKWKDVYWKYLQHIVKEGLDSMMKKDEASRNWPPNKTIRNIKKAIDKDGNIRLFRGIKMPKEEWDRLKVHKNARMVLNNLDSWSVEDEVANGFSYVAISSSDPSNNVPVVLEYKASPEEIANGWPFVGYVNEAEFILNLRKDQDYRITSIKEGPFKKRRGKNPWLVTMEKVETKTDEEVAEEMARHRQKSSPVIFDLTGDNDWATMRDENGALGKQHIVETEEVVVATYGSTPWSNDKPPRPDRPKKKKEKVVIAEFVKKQGWSGPFTGPRGGTFMKDPKGTPVYDKEKWPKNGRERKFEFDTQKYSNVNILVERRVKNSEKWVSLIKESLDLMPTKLRDSIKQIEIVESISVEVFGGTLKLAGITTREGRVAISSKLAREETISHEIGHNFVRQTIGSLHPEDSPSAFATEYIEAINLDGEFIRNNITEDIAEFIARTVWEIPGRNKESMRKYWPNRMKWFDKWVE